MLFIFFIAGTASADEWLKAEAENARSSMFFNLDKQRMWFSDDYPGGSGYPFSRFKEENGAIVIVIDDTFDFRFRSVNYTVTQSLTLTVKDNTGSLSITSDMGGHPQTYETTVVVIHQEP